MSIGEERIMDLKNNLLTGLAVVTLMLGHANARIHNANDFYSEQNVELYFEPLGDGYRGTTWFAKPLRIDAPKDSSLKPEIMWLHLYSEGYYGFFNQYVIVNCKEPTKSHIRTADGDKISFKQSMAYPNNPEQTHDTTYPYRIDRAVVESIFKHYCL